MSILATDKKLISFGTDYSAGSGISIIDHTISIIPSAVGKTYSAGPNIDIYDVSGQPTISSKDWSSDISNASANAYEQAVSQIPEPQDLSYISATVDKNTSGIDYISSVCLTSHQDWTDTIKDASANSYTQSTSYFNNWINGQYTGDITNITNNLTSLSGDLSSYYKKTETSSKEQISDAIQYVSSHAVGDVEVNNYVHNNSATIDEVNSAYKANSASYITAHQSLEGYATEDWVESKGYITGVNLPESATWNEASNVVSSNSAQWSQGKTYEGVSPIVVNNNENKISADTWTLSAGDGISFTDNSANKVTRIDVTAQGGGSVSSKYGTISVDGSDIEATNKAIKFNSQGFTSSFADSVVSNDSPIVLTWDDYSQGTNLSVQIFNETSENATLTYSSNTNVTGEVTAASYDTIQFDLQTPNATSIQFTTDKNFRLMSTRVTAPSSFKVSELAWKSELPTYEYDSNHKVCAINGNELVGNEDYLVEQGFAQNLSSTKGTIKVFNNNKIEGTNSAIASDVIEGFVSAYNGFIVQPGTSSTLTWDRYVPNTVLLVSGQENWQEYQLNYSANTDVTGTITVQPNGQASIELPTDSTSIVIGDENWHNSIYNFTVSADNYYEIGELAWASALPTYEYDSTNKISAINGSALAGGSDIPSGTMNVSGLEYNAVNEISAYNGSAIAQYGAEKQWLVHDDTLVHAANSAQYALGVNLSAVAQLLGVDETVLFTSSWNDKLWNVNLSEPISSFKKIRMYVARNEGANELKTYEYETDLLTSFITLEVDSVLTNDIYKYFTLCKISGATYTELSARIMHYPNSMDSWISTNSWCHPIKIVGIGRKGV